jgi:hypothetical protein
MQSEFVEIQAAARRAALWRAHRARAWRDVKTLFERADGAVMRFTEANILPFAAGVLVALALVWATP